jgi:hypothetical protein
MQLVMELVACSVVTDTYSLLLPSQIYHTESEMFGAYILLRMHHISAGVLSRMYAV